jgi:hypothetical protein
MSEAWIGVFGTLIGTVLGAILGFVATWLPKRWEDRHTRRTLAAALLGELRVVEKALRDVYPPHVGPKPIELFRTPIYDNAGAHLFLFSPDTVQAIIAFYQQCHDVLALWPSRSATIELTAPVHWEFQQHVFSALRALLEVAIRLRDDEQGQLPRGSHIDERSFRDYDELLLPHGKLPRPVFYSDDVNP